MTISLDTLTDYALEVRTIADLSAGHLANIAECGSPDADDSPGADLLRSVRTDTLQAYAEFLEGVDLSTATADDVDHDAFDYDGRAAEVCDGAPSVYTHALWTQFVDLTAYREDVSDFCGDLDTERLDRVASFALYVIARRLVSALVERLSVAVLEDVERISEQSDAAAAYRLERDLAEDLAPLRARFAPLAPEGYATAVVLQGGDVVDWVDGWEAAQNFAMEGYRVVALTGDAHLTLEDLQRMLDRERASQADCFGPESLHH